MKKVRTYFERWKAEAGRREVVRFNEEEGKVRMECSELQKEVYNLKLKLKEEGIPLEQVNGMVEEESRRKKELLQKGIGRLLCFNDDKYLLPWCFDRLRQYMRVRKQFK